MVALRRLRASYSKDNSQKKSDSSNLLSSSRKVKLIAHRFDAANVNSYKILDSSSNRRHLTSFNGIVQKLHKTSGTDIDKCLNSLYNMLREYHINFSINQLLAAITNIIRPNLKPKNFLMIKKIFDVLNDKYISKLLDSPDELILHITFTLNQPSPFIQNFALQLGILICQKLFELDLSICEKIILSLIDHIIDNSSYWKEKLFNFRVKNLHEKDVINVEKWISEIFCPICDLFMKYSEILYRYSNVENMQMKMAKLFSKLNKQITNIKISTKDEITVSKILKLLNISLDFIDILLPLSQSSSSDLINDNKFGSMILPHMVELLNSELKLIFALMKLFNVYFGQEYKIDDDFIKKFYNLLSSKFPLTIAKQQNEDISSRLHRINLYSNYILMYCHLIANNWQKADNRQISRYFAYFQKILTGLIIENHELELYNLYLKKFPLNDKKLQELQHIINENCTKIYKKIHKRTLINFLHIIDAKIDVSFLFLNSNIENQSKDSVFDSKNDLVYFLTLFHDNEYYRCWFYTTMLPFLDFNLTTLNLFNLYLPYTKDEWKILYNHFSASQNLVNSDHYLKALVSIHLAIDDIQINQFTIFLFWILFENKLYDLNNIQTSNNHSMKIACVDFIRFSEFKPILINNIIDLLPFDFIPSNEFDYFTTKLIEKHIGVDVLANKFKNISKS